MSGPVPDCLAADPRHRLLLHRPPPSRPLLRGRQDLLVGGSRPLPLVRRLRSLHEVQRGRRGQVPNHLPFTQG